MPIYADHWENPPKRRCGLATAMRPKRCSNLDGQFFLQRHFREQVMRHARQLRNSVSHRDSLDEHSAWHSAWNTILCFILMDEGIRDIEVESLVEASLTQTDALVRLYNASWDDEITRRDAIVQACRREDIKTGQLSTPKRKSLALPITAKLRHGKAGGPRFSKCAKAKWSLNKGEKQELRHSAVRRFVLCDSHARERRRESVA